MKYIEVIGLPGSGKTTAIEQIKCANKAGQALSETPIVEANEALCSAIADLQPILRHFWGVSSRTKANAPLRPIVRRLQRKYFSAPPARDIEEVDKVFHEAIRIGQRLFFSEIDYRSAREIYTLPQTINAQYLIYRLVQSHLKQSQNTSAEKLVLFDQFLHHNIVRACAVRQPLKEDVGRTIKAYLRKIPRPAGLFFLRGSTKLIVERLRERKKTAVQHEGFDVEELYSWTSNAQPLIDSIYTVAKQEGYAYRVVDFDGKCPEYIRSELQAFLKDLSHA